MPTGENMEDRYLLYKMAVKKVSELGFDMTKDRVWDQFVNLCISYGMKSCLEPHKFQPYWERLQAEGIVPA